MKYCANCGNALDDAAVFCGNCGAQQQAAAPVAPVTPAYQAPAYQAPVSTIQEGPDAGAKVMGVVGFILTLMCFIFAILNFIITGVAAADYDDELASIGLTLIFTMLAPNIIGLCLCGSAIKNRMRGIAVTGKVFGIIGLALSGLNFILACVGMS